MFASLKAFFKEIFIFGNLYNCWLGITIRVSTNFFRFSTPSSAFFLLKGPSKSKGLVTTATVSIPILLAISATTGDAPVPVPPPIPAVINNISVPSRTCFIFSSDSFAAIRPFSGIAPAPVPFPNNTFV